MKLLLAFATVLLLALPLPSAGQPGPPEAQPAAALGFELGQSFGSELADDAGRAFGEIDVRHYGASVLHRFSLDARTGLALQLKFDAYDLDLNPRVVPLPEDLRSLALDVTLRRRVDDRWTLLGSVTPGFFSSGSGLDGDGFGVNVRALALYRQSPELTWAFGLMYRSLAKDNLRWLPAFGVEWRPRPRWTATVGFPRVGVTYAMTDDLRLLFGASARGGTYRIEEPVGQAVAGAPDLRGARLDYTEIRVGWGIDYRLRAALELSAEAGVMVHQEFDYYERDYQLEADDASAFVRMGLTQSF